MCVVDVVTADDRPDDLVSRLSEHFEKANTADIAATHVGEHRGAIPPSSVRGTAVLIVRM